MEQISKKLAKSLLDIQAVLLRPNNAFVWASGWHSPIYCDNRKILSYPAIRDFVAESMAAKIAQLYPDVEIIAGVATGAIAHGMLVADKLKKAFIYVRAKAKDHGTGSQVEGVLPKGAKVVVIEDLISTGMSSLAAVQALKDAGAEILSMQAIFSYGFDVAKQKFEQENINVDTLTNYQDLIEVAKESSYIKGEDVDILIEWRKSPSTWRHK